LLETSVAGVQILENVANELKETIAENIKTIATRDSTIIEHEQNIKLLKNDKKDLQEDLSSMEAKVGETESSSK